MGSRRGLNNPWQQAKGSGGYFVSPRAELTNGSRVAWAGFRSVFPGQQRVRLAVIPAHDDGTMLPAVTAARDDQADGVFLVSAGLGHQRLLRAAAAVVDEHPGYFVGVSCLDLRPQDVFCRLPAGVSGVWSRQGLGTCRPQEAAAVAQAWRASHWRGLFFAELETCTFLAEVPPSGGARAPPMPELVRALQALDGVSTVLTLAVDLEALCAAQRALVLLRQAVGVWPMALVSWPNRAATDLARLDQLTRSWADVQVVLIGSG